MTAREYLRQAYRLDQRIRLDTMEVQNLRELAEGISAVRYDADRVQTSRKTDAPFVGALENLWEMEEKTSKELEALSKLKKQIQEVIGKAPDMNERLVLKYRYLSNFTWEQIGMELCADESTVRRWHCKALRHLQLPEKPIVV